MTRKEIKRHYFLNTGADICAHGALRLRWANWHKHRKWIPDHLRMKDGSLCYCHGLSEAPA